MVNTANSPTDSRPVVVGTDFSEGAKPALARAVQIAKASGSRLVMVHVVPENSVVPVAPLPGDWSAPIVHASTPEGRAGLDAAARMAEQKLAADVGMPDAEAVVRTGKPHETLALVAEMRRARLLVLGVHAPLAPFESFFLGSTAERALRLGSTPVLLARSGDEKPYGRILVPVDLGDMSLSVLRFVAENFPDAAYDVVHFLRPTAATIVTSKERHDTFAASLAGLSLSAGLSPTRTRVRVFVAEPREGIVAEVRSRRPDLVAMGTRARSGIARVLLGSVADYVIHAAGGVDVLAIPPAGESRAKRRAMRAANVSRLRPSRVTREVPAEAAR